MLRKLILTILILSGYSIRTIDYFASSNINAEPFALSFEETMLSDSELIEKFAVKTRDNQSITVDQSAVDYGVPGDYQIIFTDEDGASTVGMLTLFDINPMIYVTGKQIKIKPGSSITEIMNQLEVGATEIRTGDLTEKIIVDDRNIDYMTEGEYDLIVSVEDEEGNFVSRNVLITVTDDISDEIITEIETKSSEIENAKGFLSSVFPTIPMIPILFLLTGVALTGFVFTKMSFSKNKKKIDFN